MQEGNVKRCKMFIGKSQSKGQIWSRGSFSCNDFENTNLTQLPQDMQRCNTLNAVMNLRFSYRKRIS
jgi:hypothetical protein